VKEQTRNVLGIILGVLGVMGVLWLFENPESSALVYVALVAGFGFTLAGVVATVAWLARRVRLVRGRSRGSRGSRVERAT